MLKNRNPPPYPLAGALMDQQSTPKSDKQGRGGDRDTDEIWDMSEMINFPPPPPNKQTGAPPPPHSPVELIHNGKVYFAEKTLGAEGTS